MGHEARAAARARRAASSRFTRSVYHARGGPAPAVAEVDDVLPVGDLHETLVTRFGDKVRTKIIEPRRGLFQLPRIGLAADVAAAVEDRAQWSRFGL